MYNLKITLRRLVKDKVFSSINFIGLVIGIVSFLILFLYVSNEKSFDKHFSEHEKIYRVTSIPGGRNSVWARSLGIINSSSVNITEVEMATSFSHSNVGTIKIGEISVQQINIMSVDNEFVEMFEVKSMVGDLSEINNPNTVFISGDFAKKYFGNSNPVGQVIKVEALQYARNVGDYEVRGIVKNTHPKTHFKYDLLLSQKGGLQERFEQLPNRKTHWAYNYFKLHDGANPELVAEKIETFYNESSLKQTRGPKDYNFSLTPITDIHLKSDCRFELRESSGMQNTGLFILIAFVILLVSLLNYTNLTIARLMKRSKELGLKKSVGAKKVQLIGQVIFEVLFFCLAAIAISFVVVELMEPLINQIFEIEFEIYYSEPNVYLSILAVLGFCVGLAAIFVSVFLLGRRPANYMMAEKNSLSNSYVLKSLLVVQVAIVIVLLSGTFLVNKQISFVLNKPLGFDKDHVVVLNVKDFSKDPAVFANELEKSSHIESVGFALQHFGYPAQGMPLDGLGIDGTAEFVFANYSYLKTMNIKLLENWISLSADTVSGMVVNNHLYQRLMEKHGSMEALMVYQETQPLAPDQDRIKFIGVAEDFNYSSAHQSIGDFAFWLNASNNRARFIHVRLAGSNLSEGMDAIKRTWQSYYPDTDFNHFFVDEKIAAQYKAETILSRILSAFSIVGILISVIGISALSVFISQQRTKEIGVRKVNGAKISEVLIMLNKDFVKWVAIAFVIACPIAWYAMNKWLQNFAYKTELSWWIFALAGVLAVGVTLLTVSWQSYKAAKRNPVEALRYE